MKPKERHIVSAPAKWEYLQAVYPRYRAARRREKQRILDEFCGIVGYHRKYAIRLLNGPAPGRPRAARRRAATYGPAVIAALHAIWQAAGYPWSVRLKALLPLWLPWARRRLRLARAVERPLLAISPRQIDRRHELRLFQTLFLPSVKLVGKLRVGSRLRRRYDAPRTPLERVQAAPQQDPAKVAALLALRQRLDPFVLADAIDQKIERLYALAEHRQSPGPTPEGPPLPPGRRPRRRGGFPSLTFGKHAHPHRRRLVTS
jgi:hypothetical protein